MKNLEVEAILKFYRYVDLDMSDGELRETQTANYFSNLYPIDCAVPAVNACSCRKCGALQSVWIPI